MKKLILTVLVAALLLLIYSARLIIPYPTDYVTRLNWLSGWYAPTFYDVNCSGFIANAHGERYLNPEDYLQGANGKLYVVATFEDYKHVDESLLLPGDVGVFHRQHIAAFLKPGEWVDSDARRGSVAKYSLQDIKASDSWFQGPVTVMRWRNAGAVRFVTTVSTSGRFAGETEASK